VAARQPPCRWEAAGWRASHNPKKGFDGFAGFVTNRKTTNQQNKS
jgi:hypothetical protein